MRKVLLMLAFVSMMAAGQVLIAQDSSSDMDAKRKATANKIVNEMVDSGASQSDIAVQQKVNKETLGHEGDVE